MKKTKGILIFLLAMVLSSTTIYADSLYTAKASEYVFTFQQEPVEDFPVLSINGGNYVPVSVTANFFGFTASFDKSKPEVVELVYGNTEEEVLDNLHKMLDFVKKTNRSIGLSKQKLSYGGQPIEIKMLNIEGYNFIEINDVAGLFGVYVYQNEAQKTIDISAVNDAWASLSKEEIGVYRDYLNNQVTPFSVNDKAEKGLFANSGLDQYNLYLVGEHHATAKNFDLELYLIKYLHETQGVRYILTETGYSDAQLFNRYLQTGDTKILDGLIQNLKGTFGFSKENRALYEKLYTYNKTLKTEEKLEFIGVDIQHQIDTGMDYLLSLIKDTQDLPEVIKKDKETMIAVKESDTYEVAKFKDVVKSISDHQELYQQYTGDSYQQLKNGADNILQTLQCKEKTGQTDMVMREKFMKQNFIYQYEQLNQAKCFGMFGGFHTVLDGKTEDGEDNLFGYLDKRVKATKGKIASISVVYHDSSYMERDTGNADSIANTTMSGVLAEIAKSDYALFRLNGEGSPFIKDGSAKDQQYLILIQNSPAATRYQSLVVQ